MTGDLLQAGLVLCAALCALAYLLRYCHLGPSAAKSAIKTASVALLSVAALLAPAAPLLLALALALCALGDYLLARAGDAAFMAGVGAFAAGHVGFVALFLTHPAAVPARLADPPALLALALLALFGAGMAWLLFSRAGALRWAVLGYVPVILAMGAAALALPGQGARGLVLPAALMFMASDSLLALEKFVLAPAGGPARAAPYAIWTLYWGAQLLFFLAFSGPVAG